jgi:hypothetical protein
VGLDGDGSVLQLDAFERVAVRPVAPRLPAVKVVKLLGETDAAGDRLRLA